MAMVLGEGSDPQKLRASMEKAGKDQQADTVGPIRILHDLRFFAYPGDLPGEAAPAPPAAGDR
jgi:hypothetical protein